MRILQLIDSLEPGGAERVAITFANSLVSKVAYSGLCVTRKEGILKPSLHPDVDYLFLEKKTTFDFTAVLRLKKYIKQHNIEIVHAHTTSFFFGTLIKLFYPKISLIWHEHLGNRVTTSRLQNKVLFLCSFFFKKIVVVNQGLKQWCNKNLNTRNVIYLPNFVLIHPQKNPKPEREKTIICVANLRSPKNHLNLLAAFNRVVKKYPNWKLQLVGKDLNDDYSQRLKLFVNENGLDNDVHFMGSSNSVDVLLEKAAIGVLSSDNEGLPIALLEYGVSGVAVITTRVGYCEEVISTFGKIVPPNDSIGLAEAIMYYVKNETERIEDADAFRNHVHNQYSLDNVLPKLVELYRI